jgi:hypothetical protein
MRRLGTLRVAWRGYCANHKQANREGDAMTDIQETLRRLANRFAARDIMKPAQDLVCAATEDEARRLLAENACYDIIPIRDGHRLSSFLERDQQRPRVIQIQHVVGAGTPIPEVVDSLSDRRFVFVVGSREVIGLLHFSDLNDPVVKLPYFVLVEGVERRLADCLRDRVTNAVLADLIRDPVRLKALRNKMTKLRGDHADRDWVTLMYFREVLDAAVHFGTLSLTAVEIEDLSVTRTRVAHAAADELVESHGDVRRLSRVRQLCTDILLGRKKA